MDPEIKTQARNAAEAAKEKVADSAGYLSDAARDTMASTSSRLKASAQVGAVGSGQRAVAQGLGRGDPPRGRGA